MSITIRKSLPGHQLPFGTSISEQLKRDLNQTTGLISLITQDSLRSTWVLFELGSAWSTNKLIIPILGPELTYDDLPGPLKDFPGVSIEDENPSYRMTDMVNQLASSLKLSQEINPRKDAKLNQFITKFKSWKSQLNQADSLQKELIQQLQEELKDQELLINQLQQQIKTLQSSGQNNTASNRELKSDYSIDNNYKKLEKFLAAQKFRDADFETYRLMIQTVGKQEGQFLELQDIDHLPCDVLCTIDKLWIKYSNGYFGFSRQKEIWEECGSPKQSGEKWRTFADRVGWRKGEKFENYDSSTFDLSAPDGQFPSYGWWGENPLEVRVAFFSRVKACNL